MNHSRSSYDVTLIVRRSRAASIIHSIDSVRCTLCAQFNRPFSSVRIPHTPYERHLKSNLTVSDGLSAIVYQSIFYDRLSHTERLQITSTILAIPKKLADIGKYFSAFNHVDLLH